MEDRLPLDLQLGDVILTSKTDAATVTEEPHEALGRVWVVTDCPTGQILTANKSTPIKVIATKKPTTWEETPELSSGSATL